LGGEAEQRIDLRKAKAERDVYSESSFCRGVGKLEEGGKGRTIRGKRLRLGRGGLEKITELQKYCSTAGNSLS